MNSFPHPNTQDNKTSLERASAISQIIIAATSVFSLFVILLTNVAALPAWVVYIPVATLVVALVVWLYPKVGRYVGWRRKKILAKSKFPKLILLAEEFQHLSSPQQADTITSALANIQKQEVDLQNIEFSQLCAWIINNLIERLRISAHDFDSLRLGIQELHALTHSYHRLYFFDTIEKVRQLPFSSLPVDSLRTIEVAREAFTAYLDKFQGYCKEINEALGTTVFNFYFQKAKPVWPSVGEAERRN